MTFLFAACLVRPAGAQDSPIDIEHNAWISSANNSDLKPSPRQKFEPKSPYLAGGLAVGSILGFWGIAALNDRLFFKHDGWNYYSIPPMALSIAVTPSAGHIYAKEYRHALVFSGLRLGLFGTMVAVAPAALIADDKSLGTIAAFAGIGWFALFVYDLVDAPRAARRYNDRKRKELERGRKER